VKGLAQVRFKKLKLSGFGPYRDTVVCELTDGINTLVARNETGKSSLVAGLVATIFGLPRKSNREDFGTERFKNWHGPVRFEGEVEFEVDSAVYTIWREFDSFKISLSVFENEKQRNLVSGEHNTQATKRNIEYEKWLKRLFGMASRELFEATFCVTQPLPETKTTKSTKRDWQGQKELDKDVQELLSGTGIAFARAQDILFEDLKRQTKFTRERIHARVDQRTDGELEVIDERIADLSARLQEAKGIADSLEVVRTQLDNLDRELNAKSAELKGKRDTFNALTEWRRLKSEYDQAVLDLSRIQKASRDAELYEKEIADGVDRLKSLYPEFTDMPETIGTDLDTLVSLGQQLSAAGERISKIKSDLSDNKTKKKGYEEALSSLRNWGELGRTPAAEVRARRRTASGLMQQWNAFRADLAEQEKCQEALSGELALIDNAKDEDRKALATYEVALAKLEAEKAETERRLSDIEAKFREYEQNQQEYSRIYEDIAHLGPDAASAIAKKIQLIRFQDSIRRKSEELKTALTPPAWARIVATLVFAASGWGISRLVLGAPVPASGEGLSLWAPWVIAPILGCLGWFIAAHVWLLGHSGLKKEESAVAASLTQCRSEMDEIDASLGDSVASSDEAELGRLQERLSQRDRAKEALDEKRSVLPQDEDLIAKVYEFKDS
jgi:chromosome segregation protein